MDVARLDVESIHKAFSPASEIRDPDRFVGRPEEINAGITALMNRGGFMVVYGLRGVGKSSIAYQLMRIAEGDTRLPKLLRMDRALPRKGFNYIVRYVRIDAFTNDVPTLFKRILFGDDDNPNSLFSLTKAGDRYLTEFKRVIEAEGSGSFLGIKIGSKGNVEKRYATYISDDVVQQFRQLLGTIQRDNQDRSGLLILIDEFDTLKNKEGFASIVKACSSDFVKFGIIGIATNLDELMREHNSIGRQVDQIRVPLMSVFELQDILTKAEYLVSNSIRFTVDAKLTIANASEGFPYFTHLLGKEAMLLAHRRESPVVDQIDIELLRSQISGGRLKTVYEDRYCTAIRDSAEREILLKALADQGGDEIYVPAVYKLIKELGIDNGPQLMKHLTASTAHGAAVLTEVRSKYYRFSDPVFKTYSRMRKWLK